VEQGLIYELDVCQLRGLMQRLQNFFLHEGAPKIIFHVPRNPTYKSENKIKMQFVTHGDPSGVANCLIKISRNMSEEYLELFAVCQKYFVYSFRISRPTIIGKYRVQMTCP
jgi:hypothetical protein